MRAHRKARSLTIENVTFVDFAPRMRQCSEEDIEHERTRMRRAQLANAIIRRRIRQAAMACAAAAVVASAPNVVSLRVGSSQDRRSGTAELSQVLPQEQETSLA